jgi:hypothetical protein
MTRCSAVPLPKLLQVVHREVVPGQEQQAVEEHAGVPGREHESIAVRPGGISRIVTEVRVHRMYAIVAAPIGIPGCPEFAF